MKDRIKARLVVQHAGEEEGLAMVEENLLFGLGRCLWFLAALHLARVMQ